MRRMRLMMMAALILAPGVALAQGAPDKAQPKLPTETLTIINQQGKAFHFIVELATTPEEQETGLMFRKTVPADAGMLFTWTPARVSEMWMKNTLAPLDMVFIGPHGTIRHIAEDTVPQSLRVISSGAPVTATLELQGGITAKDDIDVGDKVVASQFQGSGK